MEDNKDVLFHEVFDNSDKRSYDFGVFVKFVNAAQVAKKFDQLIFLDVIIFLFLPDLLEKKLPELLFQKHFMKTDQNL